MELSQSCMIFIDFHHVPKESAHFDRICGAPRSHLPPEQNSILAKASVRIEENDV